MDLSELINDTSPVPTELSHLHQLRARQMSHLASSIDLSHAKRSLSAVQRGVLISAVRGRLHLEVSHLALYSYAAPTRYATTPTLDRLAREGLIETVAEAQARYPDELRAPTEFYKADQWALSHSGETLGLGLWYKQDPSRARSVWQRMRSRQSRFRDVFESLKRELADDAQFLRELADQVSPLLWEEIRFEMEKARERGEWQRAEDLRPRITLGELRGALRAR